MIWIPTLAMLIPPAHQNQATLAGSVEVVVVVLEGAVEEAVAVVAPGKPLHLFHYLICIIMITRSEA